MLKDFEPGELPGGDVKGASEDTTSYERIEKGTKVTFETCLKELKLFGWMRTGMACSKAFVYLYVVARTLPQIYSF